jgi:hypothetical protein
MCGGKREVKDKICQGCGTHVSLCKPDPTKRRGILTCPGCGSDGTHRQIEHGRQRCVKCNSVFEAADFSFLDDRPEYALEKKEQLEQQMRKRR